MYALYSIIKFVSNICVLFGNDGRLSKINRKYVLGKVRLSKIIRKYALGKVRLSKINRKYVLEKVRLSKMNRKYVLGKVKEENRVKIHAIFSRK